MYDNNLDSIEVTTDVVNEPVSLDDVKSFLRIDFDTEDLLIKSLIKSARVYCEKYTGITFAPKKADMFINYQSGTIKLPVYPVTKVNEVNFIASDGSESEVTFYTLSPDTINIDSLGAGMYVVDIEYGYASLPDELKTGLLMAVGLLYAGRELTQMKEVNQYLSNFKRF